MDTTNDVNPLKTNGFAFIEFAAKNKSNFDTHFTKLGFSQVGIAKQRDVSLYQQGDILFFVNNGSDSKSHEFANLHGDSAFAQGFYVDDPEFAYQEAQKRGAKPFKHDSNSVFHNIPAIEGIGGTVIYFVTKDDLFLERFAITARPANLTGLVAIDHLTHNVYRGQMKVWADFYSKIFGFSEIRYFDINGKKTGLFSKAMISACGKIKIPLNESKDDKSQIEEFLHQFNGEGIQHIALTTKNIYESVVNMRKNGVKFLDTPDTYYELIDQRLPNHGEDINQLQKNKILVDGTTISEPKLLLQIFTENLFGPVFFEIIQRKGDEGFGEGNFQALFDSIELDQVRRGVI